MSENLKEKNEVRKRKTRWSDDEIFFLKECYASYHHTIEDIAKVLEVSNNTVYRKAKELGIKKVTCSSYPVAPDMKICRDCKKVKPLTEFWKNNTKTSPAQKGRDTYCIECAKDRVAKKKLEALKNIEKQKETDLENYIKEREGQTFCCSTCKEEKPIEGFSVHLRKDGKVNELGYRVSRSSICKACYIKKSEQYSIKKLQQNGHI